MTATINWRICILFLLASLFFLAQGVFAQDSTSSAAQKYGITFPITELGNCSSIAECKTYCSDVANQQACLDFAQKHHIRKEEPQTNNTEIMAIAKLELGCDSTDSCRTFCGETQNWERCGEFAKKHKLSQPKPSTSPNPELLNLAKETLGCTNGDSCRQFCSQAENREKCIELTKKLQEITQKIAPLLNNGCQNLSQRLGSASAEAIKAYYTKYCIRSLPPVPSPKQYASNNPYPLPSSDRASRCKSYPGYHWNGTACIITATTSGTINTESVRGIATERGLIQKILSWFGF